MAPLLRILCDDLQLSSPPGCSCRTSPKTTPSEVAHIQWLMEEGIGRPGHSAQLWTTLTGQDRPRLPPGPLCSSVSPSANPPASHSPEPMSLPDTHPELPKSLSEHLLHGKPKLQHPFPSEFFQSIHTPQTKHFCSFLWQSRLTDSDSYLALVTRLRVLFFHNQAGPSRVNRLFSPLGMPSSNIKAMIFFFSPL